MIAAQSAGEPGTQMTLDASTRRRGRRRELTATGLPRIEELFEARRPRGGAAPLAPVGGRVSLARRRRTGDGACSRRRPAGGEAAPVALPAGAQLIVADGAPCGRASR